MNITTIIILISIYIIFVLVVRTWIKTAYSKNGRWYVLQINISDFLWTVIPVANTLMMFVMLTINPYHDSYKKSKNFNKFFGVKK